MSVSVRLSEEETALFKGYAAMKGISVPEMIRRSVLERMIVILVFSVGHRSNGCSHLDRVFLDPQKSVSKV